MEISKARKLKPQELEKEIDKTRKQVVELRSEIVMRRVKDIKSLHKTKKYLSRLLTIAKEQSIIKSLKSNNE